jgi:hypothetical protein
MTTNTETTTCIVRAAAVRFVQLTHMVDWIWNEERQELANDLGLQGAWNTHAAYMQARQIAGLDGVER